MLEYIYFVKRPGCEDEHFDFFKQAESFALGCLTEKPIITQIEVQRNDFGECIDSCDLGTIWSWEELMGDTNVEPEGTVFSKTETFGISEDLDDLDDFDISSQIDEFDSIDNSVDFEVEESVLTNTSVNKFVIVGEREDYTKQYYNQELDTWVDSSNDATLFDDRNHAIEVLYDLDKSAFYTTRVMIKLVPSAVKHFNSDKAEDVDFKPLTEDGREDPEYERRHAQAQRGYNPNQQPNTAATNARENDLENRASRTQLGYDPHKAPSKAETSARANDLENRDAVGPDTKTISKILVKYSTLMPYTLYDKLSTTAPQVLKAKTPWWLKSSGDEAGQVNCVMTDGSLQDKSAASKQGLRPIIEVIPEDFADDKLYAPIKAMNGDWIKISDKYLLLKEPAEQVAFDGINTLSNDYDKAAIKKTLDAWSEKYFNSVGVVFGSGSAEFQKALNQDKADDAKKRESFERKPIPDGMTIEQLVEEMEENEDTVECKWCNELFDKSECRKEVDLGWLCSRCEAAIKSRGETLTFIEGDLEFLDESAGTDETESELAEKLNLDIDFSQCIDSSDMEIWGVEPIGENTYKAVLLKRYENVPFRGTNYPDEINRIESEMFDLGGLFVFHFGKDGLPCLGRWDPELLNSMGTCEIIFDDMSYDYACEKALNNVTVKTEALEVTHDLGNEYDGAYPDYKPELSKVDETPEVSDSHLRLCPECGKASFDLETGICIECGFN